jgi:hypothetical protein
MYEYLKTHPYLFPSVIGISHKQFLCLLPKFRKALREAEHQKSYAKPRKRQPGAGRKANFREDESKLFWILFYYKVYPTFRLAQFLFRLDKHNLLNWVRFLEPVLWETLGYQLDLPVIKAKYLNTIIEICPALKEFIVDCTERSINRPKDNQIQKYYYSGKKKRHTVKNQVVVNPRNKKIIAISHTVEGKRHDKKIMEEDLLFSYCPPKSKGMGDLGYMGTEDLYSRLQMIIPQKKPRGDDLTPEQKANNRGISQIRVRAEHPFSWIKHFNILDHKFRNNLGYAHQPFQILAALYNFTRNYPP